VSGFLSLDAALRPDVRFRSPFTDYHGAADVAHLLGLIGRVLTGVEVERRVVDGSAALTVFRARVADAAVDGVLVEQRDDDGLLADAMLLLRPYAGLRAAMDAMRALLDAEPLPGGR
jgi:hypothetical protein